jgi:hypothetical protein
MRTLLVIFFLAGCSGSQDAPRPIADSPQLDEQDPASTHMPPDDDGDGVPNDNDLCPLAREPYTPSSPDGCPDGPAPDAGAR